MGISVDHVPCLKAWAESLDGITFPLLSDFWPHGEVARRFGVFREADGYTERAILVIDAEGVVRYVDVHEIDDLPDIEVLFAELDKIAERKPGAVAPEGPAGEAEAAGAETSAMIAPEAGPTPAAGAKAPRCTVYCRSWCFDCRRAIAWLDAEGIDYTLVDIEADPNGAERVREIAGRIVTPTFEIGDEVVVDFDVRALRRLLL